MVAGLLACCCGDEAKEPSQAVVVTENLAAEINDEGKNTDNVLDQQVDEPVVRVATAAVDTKLQEMEDFWVTISKGEDGVTGLIVETTGDIVFVAKVKDHLGPLQDWNAKASIEQRVAVGDRIMQVNETMGSGAALTQAMKEAQELRMRIRHPKHILVNVEKAGRGLGITLNEVNNKIEMLRIRAVSKGVLQDWNMENPEKSVLVEDRIIKVNGVTKDAEAMLKALRESNELELELIRQT
mmetsp:Transcript_21540/g.49214  ORF Transcript_21540/g.49214 Transcript_21540/m.49214 type:complete len:240 (+) Transcript_21540:75-794(+)